MKMMDIFIKIICVIVVLSVPSSAEELAAAREIEEYESLESLKSQLFARCIKEMNAIKGIIKTIYVDDTFMYTRRLYEEEQQVSWVSVAGASSTAECSKKAFAEGALMFKYTEAEGCKYADNNAWYSRESSTAQGGKEVYILVTKSCSHRNELHTVGEADYTHGWFICTLDGWTCSDEGDQKVGQDLQTVNLALNKPVTASSVYSGAFKPQLAVDGVADQGLNMYHSLIDAEPNPFLVVDLKDCYKIKSLRIMPRNSDLRDRFLDISIRAGCDKLSGPDFSNYTELLLIPSIGDTVEWFSTELETPMCARYVSVQRTANDQDDSNTKTALEISELEVYGYDEFLLN